MANFVIDCTYHGVPGAGVATDTNYYQGVVSEIKASKMTRKQLKALHKTLSRSLRVMLPKIRAGQTAVDSWGEVYTKEIFDADLVYVTAYDCLARGIEPRTVVGQLAN